MTQVFINPGSGNVESGSQEQSEINIQQFIKDLGVKAEYQFLNIEENGRHTYEVKNEKQAHEIEMPAIQLNKVRYLGEEGQNIWHFPRLLVDGSSWVWKYALGVCFNEDDRKAAAGA